MNLKKICCLEDLIQMYIITFLINIFLSTYSEEGFFVFCFLLLFVRVCGGGEVVCFFNVLISQVSY